MKKVLVLGGGFAGIESAIYLRKNNYDVTVVSDRDFFYIYPTSIWIPTGESKFEDICIDLKELEAAHGFTLLVDGVTSIDAKSKRVTLQSGKVLEGFDNLVIAMGASKMKPKGVENTLSICGAPEQSLLIKKKLDALMPGVKAFLSGTAGSPEMQAIVDKNKVKNGEPHKFDEIKWFRLENLPKPLHSQFPKFLEQYKDKI